MTNKEILTIIALSALGLCLLLGLAKMAMKSDKAKKGCDKACNLLVFVAVVLVAVSQLLVKKATYMPVSPNYYYDNDTPTPKKTKCLCKKENPLDQLGTCTGGSDPSDPKYFCGGPCYNDSECHAK